MKSWHFTIFFGPFLLPCTAQLYKQVTLPGNSWPSKIKRSAVGKTNVECGSLCSGDQCDFFVLNKDTEECHIGERMGATSTLSDETDKRPAYVDVEKMHQQIEDTMIRLHDVVNYDYWKTKITKTEAISVPLTATLLDCAAPCLLTAESELCDFFVYEEESFCYLGAFEKTDGTMESSVSSFHIYVDKENLILANTAKFDVALPLPGSLWNNYLLWSKSLETNFPDDECGGFCYFHDPDPSECTFAVADVSDPTNRICYMGSFLLESGGLETGGLVDTGSYNGQLISSSVDTVIAANYKTHDTSRWTSMIYEVTVTDYVLNACGLVCLARPNKECQFFMSASDEKCYLGNFDTTTSATSVTGTNTVHINYASTSSSNTFLGQYSSLLEEADGSHLSRTITSISANPSNDEECAAYCHLANNGCIMYYFDTANSNCYSGVLTYTSGSWGLTGPIIAKFNQAQLVSTINGYYTSSYSVTGVIYEGGKYKEIESSSDFKDEDCGAYCYLDTATPCRAYSIDATKCYLLNLESGTSAVTDAKVIKYNAGIISTWRGERFYSYTGHGYRWPKFIYSTINGIDDYTCAMYCHHDTQCSYYVYYGSSCYLGDCAQTTQTLSNQGHGVVYYKYDSSVCTARFVTNDQFTNVWTSFVYEYAYSGSQGENFCAMRCLMEYYDRCHFYWLHGGYCYFGNFGSPGQSVLSSDYSGETIKMFQPSLYDFRSTISGVPYSSSGYCGNPGFFEATSVGWSSTININYGNSQRCYWFIYNPHTTGHMQLSFSNFNSELDWDWMRVYIGPRVDYSMEIIYLNGARGPVTVTWKAPVVTIRWLSDYAVTPYGMSLGTISHIP